MRNGGCDVGAHRDLGHAVVANARAQLRVLVEGSPVLAELHASGKLRIAAAVYDLASGVVEVLV